jgi:hypothetical protein
MQAATQEVSHGRQDTQEAAEAQAAEEAEGTCRIAGPETEAAMDDEPTQPTPAPPAHRGRRYRRRELALADGGRLVLRTDGTIEQRDAHGAVTQAWPPDDAGWPDRAIRFGLRPQAPTVRPEGHSGRSPDRPG